MKQYLRRFFGTQRTTVIELNRHRYVEIAHGRPIPIPIYLAEELWLSYVEPLKKDKEMQETQLGSMLNGFDYASFQWKQNPRGGPLYFHAHLLEPLSSEMSFVAIKADVAKYEPQRIAVFLESVTRFTT